MAMALQGLVVLDLTNFLSGPYCTMLLGDMGADVIKVERPGTGDDARRMPPFVDGRSAPFSLWNRNKRSIALDMKDGADAEVLCRLAARADVLVENFRPGTLDRVGLSWEAVRDQHPRLIYASISGFNNRPVNILHSRKIQTKAGIRRYEKINAIAREFSCQYSPLHVSPRKIGDGCI